MEGKQNLNPQILLNCVLCCQRLAHSDEDNRPSLTSFCEEVHSNAMEELGGGGFPENSTTVCMKCRIMLTSALDMKRTTNELERKVNELQNDFSRSIKKLQIMLDLLLFQLEDVDSSVKSNSKDNDEAQQLNEQSCETFRVAIEKATANLKRFQETLKHSKEVVDGLDLSSHTTASTSNSTLPSGSQPQFLPVMATSDDEIANGQAVADKIAEEEENAIDESGATPSASLSSHVPIITSTYSGNQQEFEEDSSTLTIEYNFNGFRTKAEPADDTDSESDTMSNDCHDWSPISVESDAVVEAKVKMELPQTQEVVQREAAQIENTNPDDNKGDAAQVVRRLRGSTIEIEPLTERLDASKLNSHVNPGNGKNQQQPLLYPFINQNTEEENIVEIIDPESKAESEAIAEEEPKTKKRKRSHHHLLASDSTSKAVSQQPNEKRRKTIGGEIPSKTVTGSNSLSSQQEITSTISTKSLGTHEIANEKNLRKWRETISALETMDSNTLSGRLSNPDSHGEPLLISILKFIDLPVSLIEKIKNCGVNFNLENNYGQTPLSTAITYGRELQTIRKIVDCGGNINWIKHYGKGESLLHLAAERGNEPLIRYLVSEKSLDVNVTDKEGMTPLDHVTFKSPSFKVSNNLATLRTLQKLGGRFNTEVNGSTKTTLLHFVASSESASMFGDSARQAEILLHLGLKVDKRDGEKNTPLHLACELFKRLVGPTDRYDMITLRRRFSMIKLLINYGADLGARNKQGKTPFELMGELPEHLQHWYGFLKDGKRVIY